MSDDASEIARLRAALATSEAMIKHLKLEIAKLRLEQYGHSLERHARLIDQMELQLGELEAAASEDEIVAEKVAKTTTVASFERRRPARKPFPEHLQRERVVIAAPAACSCRGSDCIVKMGKDITETLERHPAVMEADPDSPREVHLPALREDQSIAGAVPPHAPWLGQPEPPGDDRL